MLCQSSLRGNHEKTISSSNERLIKHNVVTENAMSTSSSSKHSFNNTNSTMVETRNSITNPIIPSNQPIRYSVLYQGEYRDMTELLDWHLENPIG